MPVLANQQHEAFCQNVVRGLSLTQAAKQAGFSPQSAANRGHRLSKDPNVQQRIAELRSAHPEGIPTIEDGVPVEVTRQWLTAKLVAVHEAAVADQDLSAANKSLELLARMGGHLSERKEGVETRNLNIRNASASQLLEVLRIQFEQLSQADQEQVLQVFSADERAELLLEAGTDYTAVTDGGDL